MESPNFSNSIPWTRSQSSIPIDHVKADPIARGPRKFALNLIKSCISPNVEDDDVIPSSKCLLEEVSSKSDGPNIKKILGLDKTFECPKCYNNFNTKKQLKKHRKIGFYCDSFGSEVDVECIQCHTFFRFQATPKP